MGGGLYSGSLLSALLSDFKILGKPETIHLLR